MAAVTWKNIAPSNPSGILSAANQAAQGMSEGLGTIGENINQFATDKETSETNAFVADLMAAGSQEERDAMIGAANQSWLNLDQVNKTNYELGAPDREQAAYEKELASKHYFDKLMQGIKHENDLEILTKTPSKSSKSNSNIMKVDKTDAKNPGDPTNKLFSELEDENKGGFLWANAWTPFGSDFGEKEQKEIVSYSNDFLDTYGSTISRDELNEAFNTQTIQWADRPMNDDMTFNLDGKTWSFDEKDSKDALHEKLMQIKRNKAEVANEQAGYEVIDPDKFRTQTSIAKNQYFDEFTKNNPKLDVVQLQDLFFTIWNQNQNSIDKNKFSSKSKGIELFKTYNDAKEVTADMEWDGGWYTGPGSGYTEFIKKRDALRKSAKEALSK